MQRTGFVLLLLLGAGTVATAQDSIPPEIHIDERGDSLHFSAALRPLRQLAGAPAAYYSYFWELGDGRFSFDKEPSYLYRDTGLYQIRLYATNNYDDGNAPPTRPRPVHVKKGSKVNNTWASHFFHDGGGIEMKVNRNPRPGENFVTVVGYRNAFADSLRGSIVLFYNERQFQRDGLALADQRFYDHQQPSDLNTLLATLDQGAIPDPQSMTMARPAKPRSSPLTGSASVDFDGDPGSGPVLSEGSGGAFSYASQTRALLHNLQADFARHTVLHFPAIGRNEEKFVFLEMNTLPGMIKDTNATLSMIAMLVQIGRASCRER